MILTVLAMRGDAAQTPGKSSCDTLPRDPGKVSQATKTTLFVAERIHKPAQMCLKCSMFQPDLFIKNAPADDAEFPREIERVAQFAVGDRHEAEEPSSSSETDLDLPAVLERLAGVSARPRYTYMVLNLIARAAGQTDSAGPYVREGGVATPVRDWLTAALMPMAHRDVRRRAIVAQVRDDLERRDALPDDADLAEQAIGAEVQARIMRSGRTNVSRAVSDLVRAGLIRRHYQGFRVDHKNRGGQREAVYTLAPIVRRALGKGH